MITFSNLGKYGRLGNQMFQIAGTIGIALKHKLQFGFPYWQNYDHNNRFGNTENMDIQSFFKNPLPEVQPGNYQEVNIPWGYHPHFQVHDGISLHGHMQCEKYFKDYHQVIRHYFELVPPRSLSLSKGPNGFEHKQPPPNAIAIHVRRGDYGGDYHPALGMEYYGRALDYFPSHYPVYIFSDDIPAAKKMFSSYKQINNSTSKQFNYVETDHYITDLYLITKCSHFIIANSTFSWWGAWLSTASLHKHVIAPSRWFGPACRSSAHDIYPEGWLKL